jgi:hypothetical protein
MHLGTKSTSTKIKSRGRSNCDLRRLAAGLVRFTVDCGKAGVKFGTRWSEREWGGKAMIGYAIHRLRKLTSLGFLVFPAICFCCC